MRSGLTQLVTRGEPDIYHTLNRCSVRLVVSGEAGIGLSVLTKQTILACELVGWGGPDLDCNCFAQFSPGCEVCWWRVTPSARWFAKESAYE